MLIDDIEIFGMILTSEESCREVQSIRNKARRARAELARQSVRRYLRELYSALREERGEGRR